MDIRCNTKQIQDILEKLTYGEDMINMTMNDSDENEDLHQLITDALSDWLEFNSEIKRLNGICSKVIFEENKGEKYHPEIFFG